MSILECCLIDVEGTRESNDRQYVARYRVTTDVPYEPNALIEAAQSESECIDVVGSPYPGISPDVVATTSAVTAPDGGSILQRINVGRGKSLEGGNRYRYILTATYQTVTTQQPPPPPVGESSCDPLDWCPLYRERSNPRNVEAEKAIFGGLYRAGDLQQACTVDACACPDFMSGGESILKPIAPMVPGISYPIIDVPIGDDSFGCVAPVNTAGDRIAGIIKRVSDVEVSYTRWYSLTGFDPNAVRCKRDSLNEEEVQLSHPCWGPDPLITIAPETGFIEIDWIMRTRTCPGEDTFRYWEVNYGILVRECGWCQDVQNAGLNRLALPGVEDGFGGQFTAGNSPDEISPAGRAPNVPIQQSGESGYAVSTPVPLDLNGQPLVSRDPADVFFSRWCPQNVQLWDFL